VVEWDVAKSPSKPNGRLVSFTLRALTPVGLRQAIVKNCGLSDGRDVGFLFSALQTTPLALRCMHAWQLHALSMRNTNVVLQVKQICHWILEGPQFFEPLTTVPSFRCMLISDDSDIMLGFHL